MESQIRSMTAELSHRGPDDSGIWIDNCSGVALGHTRLAILDLSNSGRQPMSSVAGRYTMVFNGEIYNHLNLREKINKIATSKVNWKGHSDTETILAGFEVWGVKKTLKNSIGMFALALWDHQEKALYLARDRLGEKPLYYGWQKGSFVFASELKAIKKHVSFEGEIDRDAIALQLRLGYIPAPYSIYKGVKKLSPGVFVKLSLKEKQPVEIVSTYWSFDEISTSSMASNFYIDDKEAIKQLDNLLQKSICDQMLSDVPLGAFLSGGVDSSCVVALMQAQSPKKVKTFSIGFEEPAFNEAIYAKAVADHLNTDHLELYVSSRQALDVIPRLPSLYDEPFSDPSQIPTFLVSEMARQHVTVALTGDGGDELFGGYNRYLGTQQWWGKIKFFPSQLRYFAAMGLQSIGSSRWNKIGHAIDYTVGSQDQWTDLSNKISKIVEVLKIDDTASLYRDLVSHWTQTSDLVINGIEPSTRITSPLINTSIVEQMMVLDTLTYLPDDVLVKVDRAAMGVGLETRVPILDHRIVEFASRLPLHMKIRNGKGKWVLREILYKYVPRELIERPKAGFGVPIDAWLRGPLRDWAECLLDGSRLRREGFLNPEPIRSKWEEHLSGKRNWQQPLWNVLMFQAWLEKESST